MSNWTRHVHPEIPVIWIENYYIEMDVLLAIPVREKSSAVMEAIEKGRIKKITREEAEQQNEKCRSNPLDKSFLEEKLADRWACIKQQDESR